MMVLRFLCVIILGIFSHIAAQADAGRYANNSVLAEGKWVKIAVDSTGIYKLTYDELRKLGFSDPDNVAVFGYGGWMLDEVFTDNYIDDLPNLPVYRGSDYLLFYGRGPVKWEYNSSNGIFEHTNNPYSTLGYYFLTDAVSPQLMGKASTGGNAQVSLTTYDDYLVHEQDIVSLNQSGRDLFGESFQLKTSQTLTYYLPGIVNAEAKATLRFVARPVTSAGRVVMTINSESMVNSAISAVSSSYTKARAIKQTGTWRGEKTEKVEINITYSLSNDQNARLDYVRLQMRRELRPYGSVTLFRNAEAISKSARYTISGASDGTVVFDVTDALNPKIVETSLSGSELTFVAPADGQLHEYALVQTGSIIQSPTIVGEIENQDLHGFSQTDMVIIAPKLFLQQAESLAEAHRERDGLSVVVADAQQIYNEFSSGTPDATAYRRFMKMFYDRSLPSKSSAPKYLLMFGDGIHDNRGVSTDAKAVYNEFKDVMLLTYQSENSLDSYSYVSDDYFGFLEDGSGSSLPSDILNVGIGRLPVRTQTEAQQAVDKIIGYMDNKNAGAWKNNIAFIADDGSSSDNYSKDYMTQADAMGTTIENNYPEFMVNRVFFDAYKKDKSSGQSRYPDVNSRIQRLLKDGLLVINYTGHGDTYSWAEERVMTENDIRQATYQNLPLWITATCDFTRFDDVNTSAGELVFLNKSSGGIALFTTTRVVYSSYNYDMNRTLNQYLFNKTDGHSMTLGQVLQTTKNTLKDSNKLNFILIGDPALKLSYPEYRAEVTTINGRSADGDTFTFKALEKITVEGEIRTLNGGLVDHFNGTVTPTVMDKKDEINTLDNNGSGVFTFNEFRTKLYTGNAEVVDGKFSFTFTVPKDISYSHEQGKMSLYAYDEENNMEAQGAYENYVVGGTAGNVETDEDGPEIRMLFLNDSTFTNGGKVNATPLFAARIWDKSGVNITGSSIGHDMMLIIDENSSQSYVLNSYYESIAGSDGEGIVTFMLPELESGYHTAEFIVWDIQNNSTRQTFTFNVVPTLKPSVIDLYATPNPAREQVEFYIVHDRPETTMNVTVHVYDLTGRLIWNHAETGSSEAFKNYIVTWDLRSNSGDRLRPGIYLYRAGISSNGSKEATKANKIIVLTQ